MGFSLKKLLSVAAPVAGAIFGGPAGFAAGSVVGQTLFGEKAPSPQVQSAGFQYQASVADSAANERIANKALELDRDKFEFLKTQAASPVSQTGSYGYPYVAVKQYKAAPLVTVPVIIAGGLLFYFVRRKR